MTLGKAFIPEQSAPVRSPLYKDISHLLHDKPPDYTAHSATDPASRTVQTAADLYKDYITDRLVCLSAIRNINGFL